MNKNNVIQETLDYDMFSFIHNNREQSRGHIEALKKAFNEVGNLTRVQPILVNERYQVIDGQHRLIACQELGEPIYFTTVSGLTISDARNMNILHREWLPLDYAKSYALSGNENYQRFLSMLEDYEVGFSNTLIFICGYQNGIYKDFRRGDFVMRDEEKARKLLKQYKEVLDTAEHKSNAKVARALYWIFSSDKYDHKRMLQKLSLNKTMLKGYNSVADYRTSLEEIYNYKVTEPNRVRLF
jgi:hypothetical protein